MPHRPAVMLAAVIVATTSVSGPTGEVERAWLVDDTLAGVAAATKSRWRWGVVLALIAGQRWSVGALYRTPVVPGRRVAQLSETTVEYGQPALCSADGAASRFGAWRGQGVWCESCPAARSEWCRPGRSTA